MDVNRHELTELYKAIYWELLAKNFKAVDERLSAYDVTKLNMQLLVGLPRLTFSWKEELTEWEPFLERSASEITNRGEDAPELLKGLL